MAPALPPNSAGSSGSSPSSARPTRASWVRLFLGSFEPLLRDLASGDQAVASARGAQPEKQFGADGRVSALSCPDGRAGGSAQATRRRRDLDDLAATAEDFAQAAGPLRAFARAKSEAVFARRTRARRRAGDLTIPDCTHHRTRLRHLAHSEIPCPAILARCFSATVRTLWVRRSAISFD